MDFTNKVVIVTGASSGMGAASALLFAKQGARVTLIGTNPERLANITASCEAAKGNPMLALRLDLTGPDSCETIVSKTLETFGRIDVLVNCAGKMLIGSLLDENIDVYDEIMNLNLRVPYKLTHLCVPHLTKTKGNVVNIIGAMFTRVRHGFLPYAIAKAGLDRFTKSAAIELATQGIRVNSVQPGLTKTNILSNMAIEKDTANIMLDFVARDMPTRKAIEAEEVAKMVVFVASDLCPNLNGAGMGIHGAMALS